MDNLTNIKNIVEKQLKTNPKLRDSDSKLVATIWYNSTHIKDMSALDLLKAIGNGDLVSWSSITRVRRKLQEINPELRGRKYQKRQESTKKYVEKIRKLELF
jgi:hypothetical protein|tara:strand:+ start:6295 stop:6600 length:306 start_codon:yes stop_codon:yes gene_type:complete